MHELVVNGFDYAVIDEVCRDDVRDAAVRIKVRMARTAADIIEIGNDLMAVKSSIGHGNFIPWVEAEFGMSDRSARRFMQVAERFGGEPNRTRVSDLSFRALSELAAPSTPDEVVDEVSDLSAKGDRVTVADIKALKEQWAEERRELKAKAERAEAIKIDFEQQLDEMRERLSTSREQADTLKHELTFQRGETPVAAPLKPVLADQEVILQQANAIVAAWNRACPEARSIAMDQMDGPVFERTRCA